MKYKFIETRLISIVEAPVHPRISSNLCRHFSGSLFHHLLWWVMMKSASLKAPENTVPATPRGPSPLSPVILMSGIIINKLNNLMNHSSKPNRDKLSRLTECQNETLHQARIDALDNTAAALKSITRQRDLTEEMGEGGLVEICAALSSAEDAMFYLASSTSSDDIRRTKEILEECGHGNILPMEDYRSE